MPAKKELHTRTRLFRVLFVFSLVSVFYLSTVEMTSPAVLSVNDKLAHLLTFFVLAFLADYSYPVSTYNWEKITALLCYGIGIECVQYFIPFRDFSLLDILADLIGLSAYPLIIPLLKKIPLLKRREGC